jgi:acyl-CoA synthetase (AMP-forming)/AMP-acid ligase II
MLGDVQHRRALSGLRRIEVPRNNLGFSGLMRTAYKRPRQVVFLSSLPATSTGKIMRRKLADALAAQT